MENPNNKNKKYLRYKKMQIRVLFISLILGLIAAVLLIVGSILGDEVFDFLLVIIVILGILTAIGLLFAIKSPWAKYVAAHCSDCGHCLYGAGYEANLVKETSNNAGFQLTYSVTYTCPHCGATKTMKISKSSKNGYEDAEVKMQKELETRFRTDYKD